LNDIFIELNESLDRIEVHFKYDDSDLAKIKTIHGRHFDWDKKLWTVPMTMTVARYLRTMFGERLKLGNALRAWAKDQVVQEREKTKLRTAPSAKLAHTPKRIVDVIAGRRIDDPTIPFGHALRKERPPRPYQSADIKMMSLSSAINANDVGTGKTLEAIGAIYEARVNPKPVLVIAPKRSLVNVWQTEFSRLSDYECLTSEDPRERAKLIASFVEGPDGEDEMGFALALIADDLRVVQYYNAKKKAPPERPDPLHAGRDYLGNWYRFKSANQKALFEVDWGAFIIDEFHATGLPNRKAQFHVGAQMVKAEFKWPMSGTPIGGKPERLWPVLNFIDKRQYSSFWRWADEWLSVTEEEVYVRGGHGATKTVKKVGGIKNGFEEEFYKHHINHLIRRDKKEALPGLPDAVEILVETPMDGRQLHDYIEFDQAHEIVLDGKRLSGSIVLAQYTRLRQMANSKLDWDKFFTKPVATKNSCKLEYLLERLDENGIRSEDWEPGARAYVGVLEISYMQVVADYLTANGIDVEVLHGGTKDSKPMLDKFASQSKRPFVIVMTIQTGGTALNLERANSAHALDEAWDPDVMHQFFGRGDRGSRDTALKCYTYRTPHSIQEYIARVAGNKKLNNRTVLNYVKEIEELRRASR
jgi:SNF2 family DNA or RNA helicase